MLFDTDFKEQFSDIRCFDDSEVSEILTQLKDSKRLEFVFSQLFPGETIDTTLLYQCTTVSGIQQWLLSTLVPKLADSYDKIEVMGLDQLDPKQRYVFISNHRDIALDPLLVNVSLHSANHPIGHSAIGDNLLLSVTGTRMSLLNQCFRVARSVRSPKAMLIALKKQAQYIRTLHAHYNQNIWIAQREGRAMDGIDSTNPALIKMLTLGAPKSDIAATLNTLKVVPVTLSYEWDPCDVNKAKRLVNDDKLSSEQKLASDKLDILNGLKGYKGTITLRFGKPLLVDDMDNKQHISDHIAQRIDHAMHSQYEIYPINTLANKLVENNYLPPDNLTEEEQVALESLASRLGNSTALHNLSEVQRTVIHTYAQPYRLKNLAKGC